MVKLLPKLTKALRLVPLSLARTLALAGGFFAYAFDRRRRAAVLKNLRMLFPEWGVIKRHWTALKTFLHLYANIVDLANSPNLTDEKLLRLIRREGSRDFERFRDEGKGFVLLSAHLGAWDLGVRCLGAAGFQGIVLAEPIAENAHYEILQRYRARGKIEVLPANIHPIRLARALKKGGIVLLLGDRDVLGTGVEAKFGEGRRRFPKGPAELSKRLGVPVIPGFALRRTLNPFTKTPFVGLTYPAFYPEGVEDVVSILEQAVKSYPEQWMVFQNEWV